MFMNKVYTGQYKGRVNLLGVSWYLMKKIVFDHLIKQKISTGIDSLENWKHQHSQLLSEEFLLILNFY